MFYFKTHTLLLQPYQYISIHQFMEHYQIILLFNKLQSSKVRRTSLPLGHCQDSTPVDHCWCTGRKCSVTEEQEVIGLPSKIMEEQEEEDKKKKGEVVEEKEENRVLLILLLL